MWRAAARPSAQPLGIMSYGRVMRDGLRAWLPCTRARHYHAALAMLLAIDRFPKLDAPSKARVDAEVVEIMKPYDYPWWRYRRNAPSISMAACRAVAMRRLGISTGIANLTWADVLHPWHQDSPTLINLDFRSYHAATDDAVRFLASSGVTSPEIEHFSTVWVERVAASERATHDA